MLIHNFDLALKVEIPAINLQSAEFIKSFILRLQIHNQLALISQF